MALIFQGKTAVVTGGSSGIGYHIAERFLLEGANVAICATQEGKLQTALNTLRQMGKGRVVAMQCDVADSDQMGLFAEKIKEEFGGCEIWVNNAGIAPRSSIQKTTPDLCDRIFAVNVKSIVLSAHYIPKLMPNGGVVLNAGSIAGIMPTTTSGVYGASKAAVSVLTRSLAGEFAPLGIRVICYAPGMIDTKDRAKKMSQEEFDLKMSEIALRRMGTPQEIASIVALLASDNASYITGVTIEITGGKFCVQNPDLAWR